MHGVSGLTADAVDGRFWFKRGYALGPNDVVLRTDVLLFVSVQYVLNHIVSSSCNFAFRTKLHMSDSTWQTPMILFMPRSVAQKVAESVPPGLFCCCLICFLSSSANCFRLVPALQSSLLL